MKLIDSLRFGRRKGVAPDSRKQPVNNLLRTVVGGMVALMFAGGMLPTAEAAVYTRFDSSSALDEWKIAHHTGPNNLAKVTDDFEDGKALKITRPKSGSSTGDSAAVFYKGSEAGIVDGKVSDFELKSTVALGFDPKASGINSHFGFVFRASSDTYTGSNGYFLAYNAKTSKDGDGTVIPSGALVLYDKPGAHGTPGTELASVDLILDPDTYYVFKISAVGTLIKASVWDEGENMLLGELVFQDDSVRTNEGYFGARTAFSNTNVAQYVKDISITVIPEPATVAFSLIGGAAMLVVLRRRKA